MEGLALGLKELTMLRFCTVRFEGLKVAVALPAGP
jgi:hypothetical protein